MSKWKYFIGASILAAGLVLKAGAPLVPIVLGVAVAAFLTWKKSERPTKHLPR
jgi:hypothetical protein